MSSNDLSAGVRGSTQLRLVGDPAVVVGDASARSLERRAAGLLALVALEPGISRARAARLLWPESEDPRRALRQQLLRFRKIYAVELLVGDDALFLAPDLQLDLHGDASGTLLGRLAFDDCEEFADWLQQQRQRRRGVTAAGLSEQIVQAEAEGDLPRAVALAEQLVHGDGDSEAHHRQLIRLHYLAGDIAQAQTAYQRLDTRLRTRFGARPAPETEAVMRAIRAAQAAPSRRPASAASSLPVTVLRPPRLVGRSADTRQLEQAWQACSAAVVLGEAGMGKTRLLADLAARSGTALHAVARPGDSSLPYALVTRLARATLRQLRVPSPPGVVRELARLLPELGEATPLATDVDRARFFGAIDAMLAQAAAEGARGVLLDDLHYADAASIEALRHAAMDGVGLAWIVALRPAEVSTDARALIDALLKPADSVQIVLTPLSEADVAELLQSLDLDLPDVDTLAPRLARHTGGNPLFLLETIKSLWVQSRETTGQRAVSVAALVPAALPAAPNVATLITRRIGRLTTAALDLARCAAVAGQDFNAELAAHALAVRAVDLADVWQELEAAQIFRDGGFAHDLIYEAVLASVPQPVAAAMHATIAEWLGTHNGATARVALHYDLAGHSGRAAPWWLQAGQAAKSALRYAEATDAFERAAHGYASDSQLEAAFDAAYEMRLASFEVDLDRRSASALDLLERFATTPVQQARACNERAVTRLHQGDLPGTEAMARAGLKVLGGADAALLRAELRRNVAAVHVWRNETHAALHELRSIEHDIDRLATPAQRGEFYQSLAIVLEHVDDYEASRAAQERAIELLLRAGNVPGAAQTALNLSVAQHDHGDVRSALATLERARMLLAAAPEQRRSYSSLDLNYGFVLCGLGDYGAALRHLDQAVDNCRAQTPGWLPLMVAYRAQLWLHLGQPARAHRDLDSAVPGVQTPAAACSKWTVAFAQTAVGHGARSAEALARLDAVIAALPPAGRKLLRWRPELARLPHQDDDQSVAAARALLDEALAAGRLGLAVSAGAWLAQRLAQAGQRAEAATLARRTLGLLEENAPDNVYRGTVWRQCLAALESEPELLRQHLRNAVDWIENAARRTVPPEFRESFLERNIDNRELLRLATRLHA